MENELLGLRQRLLSDPYFKDVPSFAPDQKKTAIAFHAKDDVAEVRREVFTLLKGRSDLSFYAVVIDKVGHAQHVANRNKQNSQYRYKPDELYDMLAKRLFNDKLHKSDHYKICFAKRGSSDRTNALKQSLIVARQKFCEKWKIEPTATLDVTSNDSARNVCLQATDYFLWALQRLYERKEERYLSYLWPSFKLVIDMNDPHAPRYGMYYTQKKPLTLTTIQGRL